jgi:hypothetical protein
VIKPVKGNSFWKVENFPLGLAAGAYFSLGIGGHSDDMGKISLGDDPNTGARIARTDYGFQLAASATHKRFMFRLLYGHGMNDVMTQLEPASIRYRVYSLSAGYRFNRLKKAGGQPTPSPLIK